MIVFKRNTSVGLKSAIAMAAEVPAANSRLNLQSLGPKDGNCQWQSVVLLPQLENVWKRGKSENGKFHVDISRCFFIDCWRFKNETKQIKHVEQQQSLFRQARCPHLRVQLLFCCDRGTASNCSVQPPFQEKDSPCPAKQHRWLSQRYGKAAGGCSYWCLTIPMPKKCHPAHVPDGFVENEGKGMVAHLENSSGFLEAQRLRRSAKTAG